ncbi:MAG: RluA family pseudouridine synthase [Verrucomicrobiia bacterium]
MKKTDHIEITFANIVIPILFENRSILIIDKPASWLLAPSHWTHTSRNLQTALEKSIACGDYWARSRNLKYIRFLHRLDADTSGLLILVKNQGAIQAYNRLFSQGLIKKIYAAIVEPPPNWSELLCYMPLSQSKESHKSILNPLNGKPAKTYFKLLKVKNHRALLQAKPLTGRTHQIRVHLSTLGYPIIGDSIYGNASTKPQLQLALRAAQLIFKEPFESKIIDVKAPMEHFLQNYGFEFNDWQWHPNNR